MGNQMEFRYLFYENSWPNGFYEVPSRVCHAVRYENCNILVVMGRIGECGLWERVMGCNPED